MAWRDIDFLRPGQPRLAGIVPVHGEFPGVNPVILEDLIQLRAARRHHDLGHTGLGQLVSIDVSGVQEAHTVYDPALLVGG